MFPGFLDCFFGFLTVRTTWLDFGYVEGILLDCSSVLFSIRAS